MSAMSADYIEQRVWRVTRSHDLWHVLSTLKRTITKSTLHVVWRYRILVRTPSTYCAGCTCDFNIICPVLLLWIQVSLTRPGHPWPTGIYTIPVSSAPACLPIVSLQFRTPFCQCLQACLSCPHAPWLCSMCSCCFLSLWLHRLHTMSTPLGQHSMCIRYVSSDISIALTSFMI